MCVLVVFVLYFTLVASTIPNETQLNRFTESQNALSRRLKIVQVTECTRLCCLFRIHSLVYTLPYTNRALRILRVFFVLFVDGIFTTTPETRETSEYVNFINKPLRMNSILLSYSFVFSSCVFSHSYGSTAKYYLFCLLWAHTKSVEYKHTRRRATYLHWTSTEHNCEMAQRRTTCMQVDSLNATVGLNRKRVLLYHAVVSF